MALWAWAAATGGRWAAGWPAFRGRLVPSGRPQRWEARPVLWEVPGSGTRAAKRSGAPETAARVFNEGRWSVFSEINDPNLEEG